MRINFPRGNASAAVALRYTLKLNWVHVPTWIGRRGVARVIDPPRERRVRTRDVAPSNRGASRCSRDSRPFASPFEPQLPQPLICPSSRARVLTRAGPALKSNLSRLSIALAALLSEKAAVERVLVRLICPCATVRFTYYCEGEYVGMSIGSQNRIRGPALQRGFQPSLKRGQDHSLENGRVRSSVRGQKGSGDN